MTISSSALGTASVLQALQLLADPSELKKRIDEFLVAEERASKLIESIGPAQEITKLRADADSTVKLANETLFNANEQAKKILSDAKAKVSAMLAEAHSSSEGLHAAARDKHAEADARHEELREIDTEQQAAAADLQKQRDELATAKAQLQRDRESLNTKVAAVEARSKKLKEISEHIAGAAA